MTTQSVLVVGASSPIGAAIGREFVEQGAQVVGVSTETSDHPAFVRHLVADVSIPERAKEVVDTTLQTNGALDVVVLAAAFMPVASAEATTESEWSAALRSTLDSAFYISRAALPHLGKGSAVIAVTSINATLAAPGLPAYAAAKAGVEGLVRQLALEYGPRGVRVNAVAPALIGGAHLPDAAAGYPLRKTGSPEDVAAAVGFLASPSAGFITGAVLPVDGGLSIASPAAWLRDDLRARWLPD